MAHMRPGQLKLQQGNYIPQSVPYRRELGVNQDSFISFKGIAVKQDLSKYGFIKLIIGNLNGKI